MVLDVTKLKVGDSLPGLEKLVTQGHINLYAQASRDFNPIHVDPEFARKSPLGGTVAHGMLILAYLSEMMTTAFGPYWLTAGKLNVRFKAAARPGDTITVGGRVTKMQAEEGRTVVTCEVSCQSQKGEAVITGEASVRVKTP